MLRTPQRAALPRRSFRRPGGSSQRSRPRVCRAAYEAQVDASQLVVLATTAALGAYWWFSVVPAERQALGKLKRSKSELRGYLNGLAGDTSRTAERWFYSEWLSSKWFQRGEARRRSAASDAASSAASPSASTAPDAVPPLPSPPPPPAADEPYRDVEPAFWSFDNPLVFTFTALSAVVALAALVHGTG